MTSTKNDISTFLSRIEKIKASGGVDLSAAEDLSVAIMNLISLEEHFFFTGAKTKDGSYYDLTSEIRQIRTKLLAQLMNKHEGETWCASKHLLAASMRLIETGNRYNSAGDKKQAELFFADAYRLYTIFWSLKTKLVSARSLRNITGTATEKGWSLETLVAKLADCCDEK